MDALLADIRDGRAGLAVPGPGATGCRDGTLIDVEIIAGRIVFEGRAAALVSPTT